MTGAERAEPITGSETGDMLTAVGNHEGMAVLLLAMEAGERYGKYALHGLLRTLVGEEAVDLGRESNQQDWCKRSLEPFGLVSGIKSDKLEFSLTERGQGAKIMAGNLLRFGERTDRSLMQIWGQTSSAHDAHGPATRHKLVKTALDTGEGSVIALAEAISSPSQVVARHLRALRRVGLVDFAAYASKGRPKSTVEVEGRVTFTDEQREFWTSLLQTIKISLDINDVKKTQKCKKKILTSI